MDDQFSIASTDHVRIILCPYLRWFALNFFCAPQRCPTSVETHPQRCVSSLDSGRDVSRHSGHSPGGCFLWCCAKWWLTRSCSKVARSGRLPVLLGFPSPGSMNWSAVTARVARQPPVKEMRCSDDILLEAARYGIFDCSGLFCILGACNEMPVERWQEHRI